MPLKLSTTRVIRATDSQNSTGFPRASRLFFHRPGWKIPEYERSGCYTCVRGCELSDGSAYPSPRTDKPVEWSLGASEGRLWHTWPQGFYFRRMRHRGCNTAFSLHVYTPASYTRKPLRIHTIPLAAYILLSSAWLIASVCWRTSPAVSIDWVRGCIRVVCIPAYTPADLQSAAKRSPSLFLLRWYLVSLLLLFLRPSQLHIGNRYDKLINSRQ